MIKRGTQVYLYLKICKSSSLTIALLDHCDADGNSLNYLIGAAGVILLLAVILIVILSGILIKKGI